MIPSPSQTHSQILPSSVATKKRTISKIAFLNEAKRHCQIQNRYILEMKRWIPLALLPPNQEQQAYQFFQKAAESGLSLAQNNLAYFYFKGKGTRQDLKQAENLLRQAVSQGNMHALDNLAYVHEWVGDAHTACELYKKAADQGNLSAIYNLGLCYLFGKGVEKDATLAKNLLARSLEGDDRDSENHLKLYLD